MPSLSAADRRQLQGIRALAEANPFAPARVEAERRVLGAAFSSRTAPWHADATLDGINPNVSRIGEVVGRIVPQVRRLLSDGADVGEDDVAAYETAVRYLLYWRYEEDFYQTIEGAHSSTKRLPFYDRFVADVRHFLALPRLRPLGDADVGHLFALAFQIRRAFHFTFRQIYGGSMPAARLRAAVWESVFTFDLRRYQRVLFQRMGDVTTLISGASGTGKELVARAIGLARYVPFDLRSRGFAEDFGTLFRPVNLSALSPTLIESELFGHRKGAFTGALEDRSGYLEPCPSCGTVFLDEIGDLNGEIQVKLLRVLQGRVFQRIGETQDRPFRGKIIAATNRDLAERIGDGFFRADLYYRLCADVIETPTLREQLADSPDDLRNLILILCRRITGEAEAPELAEEVHSWVTRNLPGDYAWPGNVRELEQCVRNVLIRGHYRPATPARPPEGPFAALETGSITAEEALRRYCQHVYRLTGSYVETARRLGLDRRTVRAKVGD
jgi:transcriptional regulator with AAA-type ATPase domain